MDSVTAEQGWCSGESTHLPPMWPGFNSRTLHRMWVEFVVGSLLCSDRFFSRYSGFPLRFSPFSNSIRNAQTCHAGAPRWLGRLGDHSSRYWAYLNKLIWFDFFDQGCRLSVDRRVYYNPLLQIFKTIGGFSAGKIELTARYFPRLLTFIYITGDNF